MKNIYVLGVAAIFAGGVTSCTLDSVNYVEKSTSNFPITADDATQALAGIYENLNQVCANPQCSFFYLSMLASDDNFGGGGPNDQMMQAEDLLLNSGLDMTQTFWNDRYTGINRANSLLDGLDNITLSVEEKGRIEGEAKFLRAFFYYELASQYGCVPLTVTSNSIEPVQATAAEIWGQILQDLRDASTVMPSVRKTDGHVDKYTAEAMLARAWLFYTGMYANGDKVSDMVAESYTPLTSVELPDGSILTKQNVIDFITDAKDNSGYDLVSDFRCLWAYTNKYTVEDYGYTKGQDLKWVEDDNAVNPESMFAIKFNKLADWGTTIGYANGYALHFGVRGTANNKSFPFGSGWGAGPVAPNLAKDWNASDLRKNASILKCSDDFNDFELGGGGEYIQETGYLQKKLLPVTAKNGVDADGNDIYSVCFENLMYGADGWKGGAENLQLNNIHDLVLIRYADVLLMHSELTETSDGINEVRSRVGLSPISYSLEALQEERRFELAFEGVRWNDIRRWHIAAKALEKQIDQVCYTNGTEDKNFAHAGGYAVRYNATAGFFMKPESQVSLSNGGIKQNEGWEGGDLLYTKW